MNRLPSRVTTIGIFAFWLLTAGWFIRRELAPTWGAGDAPPYAIELADEAMRQAVPVIWSVHRNGEFLTTATTRVEYVEPDDTFSLNCELRKFDLVTGQTLAVIVNDLRNVYRVSRAGELLGMRTDLAVTVGGSRIDLMVAAEVKEGRALLRCTVRSPWGSFEPPLEPVPVSAAGVLNPLHPVQRVRGLRPGQRWTMPLVDPLADALRVALGRFVKDTLGGQALSMSGPRSLVAEVTGPRGLEWNGREHDCYVIEYAGDDYRAATWVRVRDGLVLRQEAGGNGDEFVLQRN
jgi:hypothetical protein